MVTEQFAEARIYVSDTGDIWELQNQMWERMYRDQLRHEKPIRPNALVYEQLDSEMISWEAECALERHITSLRSIAAKAPKECKVVIEFDRESDYDGGYDTYRRIGFYRKPTPEEVDARKERNAEIRKAQAEYADRQAEREREEFERLRAKFGDA